MFERYYRELLNFCSRMVKDRDAAADVVQESYARVLAIQRSNTPITEPRALLYQTARHVMVDRYRRDQRRSHDDIDAIDELDQPAGPAWMQPETLVSSGQAIEAYVDTIESLPPRCREAFILYIFDGLSRAEIAERMGTSVSMVEKHIARGRIACRACQKQLKSQAVSAARIPDKK